MSEATLLEFPCTFPVKAMGKASVQLDSLVLSIVQQHCPQTPSSALKSRLSKDGNYLAVTVLVEAGSKAQLDAIYQQLSDHPLVLMAL